MSKTVPIWAAVLNRAVHRLRCQRRRAAGGAAAADAAADPDAAALGEAAAAAGAAAAAAGAGGTAVQGGAEGGVADGAAAAWDCAVHLPPWVSEVEANSIRQRLDGWVDDLLGVSQCVPAGVCVCVCVCGGGGGSSVQSSLPAPAPPRQLACPAPRHGLSRLPLCPLACLPLPLPAGVASASTQRAPACPSCHSSAPTCRTWFRSWASRCAACGSARWGVVAHDIEM